MIWFCSWLTTVVAMVAIWLVYYVILGNDVALLSRELARATPSGWPDLSSFAIPLLEGTIYLLAVPIWWKKRRDIDDMARASARNAGPMVKVGQRLNNPAGAGLTGVFAPFAWVGVALSMPLVPQGILRPSIWGLCALWAVTLTMPVLLPWLFRDRPVPLYDPAEA